MPPSTDPVPTGDDTGALAADAELDTKPDLPTPGHPTVFLEDGPSLQEPAAQ
ncbi:hypothetical protein ACLBWP_05865 [Microbacterium sp. M1A1_1b]